MITCIAIDDEPLALEVLKKYASQAEELNLIAIYSDALEAVEFLKDNTVDLLFLDVNMPDINGFQLYKSLPIKPMVIFTTAYKEFAVDGFEVDAIDYLLKPFDLARFKRAVNKVIARNKNNIDNQTTSPYLYIHADYKMLKIPFEEIIYMEALDDYVKIHTASQFYMTLISMKKMMEKLPEKQFVRIHRSYIVACDKISFVQFRQLGLINNIKLPVGDTYRAEIGHLKKL
ncbi:LytTR family DNA-binding domain-containing protein [soil metagenome]